jgi:uncharacterized lipoprotein YbaY
MDAFCHCRQLARKWVQPDPLEVSWVLGGCHLTEALLDTLLAAQRRSALLPAPAAPRQLRGENGKAAVAVSPVASDGLHLPPGSSVELTLADITVAEAPPLEVAQVTYRDFPQNAPLPLPLQLALPYNPEKVLAEHTYVVSARVRDAAETLRYLNTQPVYALTRGALNDVQVVVNPVDPP